MNEVAYDSETLKGHGDETVGMGRSPSVKLFEKDLHLFDVQSEKNDESG